MATATISRGGKSVDLILLEEGGSPVVSRDVGKPGLKIHETGALDPRSMDNFAGLMQYNLQGRFVSSDAYEQARDLADLLKSHSDGSATTLDIDMPEFGTGVEVAPAAGQEQAASIVYDTGREGWVDVEVGLTRVGQFQTGSVGADQIETTPTATGSGPVEIRYGGASVELTTEIVVERVIGRHNSDVEGQVPFDYPLYQDKVKTAYDGFNISLEFVRETIANVTELIDMFTTQLRRDSLTLDFNGLYGLGEFNVVPSGSGALRTVRTAGEQGTNQIPTLSLRRVLQE